MARGSRRRAVSDEEEPEQPQLPSDDDEEEELVKRPRKKDKGKGKPREPEPEQEDSGDEMQVDQQEGGRRRASDEEEDQGGNGLQVSRSEKAARELDAERLERMIKDTVRTAIFFQNKKKPIRRQDIIDQVCPKIDGKPTDTKPIDYVIEKAREYLRDIFGMDMQVLPVRQKKGAAVATQKTQAAAAKAQQANASVRSYALVSTLPADWTAEVLNWEEEKAETGFLAFVLALIYVSGGPQQGIVREISLKKHLAGMGMEEGIEANGLPEMGKLLKKLENEGYLETSKENTADGPEVSYKWGPRAKVEYPEEAMLGIITSVYPETTDKEILKSNIKKVARVDQPAAPQQQATPA